MQNVFHRAKPLIRSRRRNRSFGDNCEKRKNRHNQHAQSWVVTFFMHSDCRNCAFCSGGTQSADCGNEKDCNDPDGDFVRTSIINIALMSSQRNQTGGSCVCAEVRDRPAIRARELAAHSFALKGAGPEPAPCGDTRRPCVRASAAGRPSLGDSFESGRQQVD